MAKMRTHGSAGVVGVCVCAVLSVLPVKGSPQAGLAEAEFEVASVKLSSGGAPQFNIEPMRLTVRNLTLAGLFSRAYSLKWFQYNVPQSWMNSQTYDIDAKAAAESKPQEMRIMLRKLLAQRFKLRFHTEAKEMRIVAVVIGKDGSKLREVKADQPTDQKTSKSFGMSPMFQRLSIDAFANMLSGSACSKINSAPVVNKTGLEGIYDLRMETSATPSVEPVTDMEQICEAMSRELGLELKPQRDLVDVYVIESADKIPSGN